MTASQNDRYAQRALHLRQKLKAARPLFKSRGDAPKSPKGCSSRPKAALLLLVLTPNRHAVILMNYNGSQVQGSTFRVKGKN